MTITANDIKLFESQRLTQNADGGGRQTGNEVVDGAVNNLFQDISRVNRAYGNVALIKAYLGVQTNTTDLYLGAHAALVRPPADENVSATLFTTKSNSDLRADARDRIESYVVSGTQADMYLFGNQLTGQRSIQVIQREAAAQPEIGDIYALSHEEGETLVNRQYISVRDVQSEIREFAIIRNGNVVNFTRRVVRIEFGTPLRNDFPGADPTDADSEANSLTVIRETTVADASRYYGIAQLVDAADQNSLELRVDDVYQQIVPVTRGETAVTDVQAGGQAAVEVVSNGVALTVNQVAQTLSKPVTINNRAYNYVFLLNPIPAQGVTVVEYRVLGKWERLVDDGTGTLVGQGTGQIDFGTGSVSVTLAALPDADTSIIVSWGVPVHYLDRAGVLQIDSPKIYESFDETIVPGSLQVEWQVGGQDRVATDNGNGIFTGDGVGRIVYATRYLSDAGSVLSGSVGAAVGSVGGYYSAPFIGAEMFLIPNEFPDPGSEIVITRKKSTSVEQVFNPNKAADGSVTLPVSNAPLKPGSVSLQWSVSRPFNRTKTQIGGRKEIATGDKQITYDLHDDSAGGFNGLPGATVDYATGEIIFKPERDNTYNKYERFGGLWVTEVGADEFADGAAITVGALQNAVLGSDVVDTVELSPVVIDFLPGLRDQIVPGTLNFTWLGVEYADRGGQGIVYSEDGVVAGKANYQLGSVTLSNYGGGGASNTVTVNTLVSIYGDWTIDQAKFRTPGTPLQPGGFILQATRFETGDLIVATADNNGVLDGPYIDGTVDFDSGVCDVRFGELVPDASLTQAEKSEPWYDPEDVDENDEIFKPEQVFPNTVRFNAVIFNILPLDADLIGLDPVRLPSDGRVPVFRPGYLLLVHHPQNFTMPNPLQADQTVNLPRGSLSHVRMLDDNDMPVPGGTSAATDQWQLDRDTGVITIANGATLDVATYPEPWIAEHVIDDLVLASDVQINGTIKIVGGLTHAFPADESYVSSVLVFGDLQARVANFFEQRTWNSQWNDTVSGSQPDASYNNVTYPVEVLNANSITERWSLVFGSSSGGEIIGETVGVIGTFSIASDVAPINPNTGEPYFIVRSDGFGGGWDAANAIRFNTVGANAPLWVARTVLSGAAELEKDQFRLQLRGDAD